MVYLNHSQKSQANSAIFHNADIIVYTEGEQNGDDAMFWTKILKVFCPNKRVKISPKGAKGILLAMLKEEMAINNFIAIDRDLENIMPNKNLIYTWGYSYENDMYSLDLILHIICIHKRICEENEEKEEIRQKLDENINLFVEKIAPYMCAYAEGLKENISVLPNPKNRRSNFEDLFYTGRHTLNLEKINSCIKRLKHKCCEDGKHSKFRKLRYCNGHLIETFFYRLINYLNVGKQEGKETIKSFCLGFFEKFLTQEVENYYKTTLAKINELK